MKSKFPTFCNGSQKGTQLFLASVLSNVVYWFLASFYKLFNQCEGYASFFFVSIISTQHLRLCATLTIISMTWWKTVVCLLLTTWHTTILHLVINMGSKTMVKPINKLDIVGRRLLKFVLKEDISIPLCICIIYAWMWPDHTYTKSLALSLILFIGLYLVTTQEGSVQCYHTSGNRNLKLVANIETVHTRYCCWGANLI